MRWIDDKPYTKEFFECLDKDNFSLTYKLCSSNDYSDCIVRTLIDAEISHPIAILIYKEIKPKHVRIYSFEVHPKNRYATNGRKLLLAFKEKCDIIEVSSLPESNIFYEKQGFVAGEGNNWIWKRSSYENF